MSFVLLLDKNERVDTVWGQESNRRLTKNNYQESLADISMPTDGNNLCGCRRWEGEEGRDKVNEGGN